MAWRSVAVADESRLSVTEEFEEEYELGLGLLKARGEAASHTTLRSLLNSWEGLPAEIERGAYQHLGFNDYTNDLTARDIIDALASQVSLPARRALEARISPADDRFRAVTLPVEEPLYRGKKGWWWFRIPTQVTGELESDLKDLGYLD
jgi:hypothetical protein